MFSGGGILSMIGGSFIDVFVKVYILIVIAYFAKDAIVSFFNAATKKAGIARKPFPAKCCPPGGGYTNIGALCVKTGFRNESYGHRDMNSTARGDFATMDGFAGGEYMDGFAGGVEGLNFKKLGRKIGGGFKKVGGGFKKIGSGIEKGYNKTVPSSIRNAVKKAVNTVGNTIVSTAKKTINVLKNLDKTKPSQCCGNQQKIGLLCYDPCPDGMGPGKSLPTQCYYRATSNRSYTERILTAATLGQIDLKPYL
jgi:hypothetical protein